MIKKQTKIIIICALSALALILVYAFILSPMLNDLGEGIDEVPELLEGEVLGMGNTIMMYGQITRENIQEIEIHNSYGNYAVYYNEKQKEFYIKNNDNAPYSKDMLSSLIVAAGYPATMMRVTENCENMSEYGLDEGDNPAKYTITTKTGERYTAYIGKIVPTGAGYYARFEGRDAVYIVEAGVKNTLLAPVENMITAILALPVTQSDYHLIKNFTISRDGKKYLAITTNTNKTKDAEGNEYEEYTDYEMIYPTGYGVSTTVYDQILQLFMNLYGESVVMLGEADEVFSTELLSQFGLNNPAYELYFEYSGLMNSIIFSKKSADGTYFAYTLMYNTICVVSEETVPFLDYDLIEYIDKPLLQYNIDDIAGIEVSGSGVEANFRVNGAGDSLVITQSSGKSVNTDDFRQFYMTFLTLQMVTYAEVTDTAGLECICTIKVTTDSGETIEFGFYPYKTRRCLYTVNGVGEFYCLRTTVDTLLEYTQNLLNGEKVKYAER